MLLRALAGRSDADRSAAWIMADRALRIGGGAAITILVSRYLGPTTFGTLSFAAALASLFATLATLGLDNIVVRELVKDPSASPRILGTTWVMRIVGSLAAIACTVVTALILRPGDRTAQGMAVLFSGASLVQAFDVIDLAFQSRVLARPVAIVRTLAFLVAAGVRVVFVLVHASAITFALAALIEGGVVALGLTIAWRRSGPVPLAWSFSAERARALLRDGAPLLLSSIAALVYLRIDQVMLAAMVGDAEVGVYSVAVRLAEAWYFVPMALVSSSLPAIVAASSDAERSERLFALFRKVAFVSYAFALFLTLGGSFLVRTLFGEEYARAGPMLAILAWGGLFAVLGAARTTFLVSRNWTGVHLAGAAIGAVVNVVLNLLLIPRLGGVGAGVASLVAYASASHGIAWIYPPLRPVARLLTRALFQPTLGRFARVE